MIAAGDRGPVFIAALTGQGDCSGPPWSSRARARFRWRQGQALQFHDDGGGGLIDDCLSALADLAFCGSLAVVTVLQLPFAKPVVSVQFVLLGAEHLTSGLQRGPDRRQVTAARLAQIRCCLQVALGNRRKAGDNLPTSRPLRQVIAQAIHAASR